MKKGKIENVSPFAWKSPEDINAKEVIELFVDVFNDFPKILLPENNFIIGPRGSGKSMMFRYMMPDCQLLKKKSLKKLDYYSIYIPIKKTNFDVAEYSRLKDLANFLINEHLLVTHIATLCFASFSKIKMPNNKTNLNKMKSFYDDVFKRRVKIAGWRKDIPVVKDDKKLASIVNKLVGVIEDLFFDCISYCNSQLSIVDGKEIEPYNGPVCTYLNFLYPLLIEFIRFQFMPQCPIFLLIDDADNLTKTQTRVLNSWVSYRSGTTISFKVSTQQKSYKTYRTTSGTTIDSPHDYSELNISTVYTSQKRKYYNNVEAIISKRLKFVGILGNVKEFFPVYEKQEKRIHEIRQNYLMLYKEGKSRGTNPNDDAYRYARPDYIKELGGIRKQKSKYFYAGFDQLVHLSSGIIRFFLEASSRMYGEMEKRYSRGDILFIEPSVQSDISKEFANEYLFTDFDKMKKDLMDAGENLARAHKLKNLIDALGGMFFLILISNAAERRVFSIALSNLPDDEVMSVLELGVQYGYFQESSIGNKEGTGRTVLYIMNRRLAPIFTLDPTSFAGYKFITNEDLNTAMQNPKKFISRIKEKLKINPDEDVSIDEQLEIFN